MKKSTVPPIEVGKTPNGTNANAKGYPIRSGFCFAAAERDMDVHTSPLGWRVIGAAIEVHRVLGPGLLESAYERALGHELRARELRYQRQVPVPAEYKGAGLGRPYRVDLIVERELIVEIKAVQQFAASHRAQMRTYLRILGIRQGLLLNFNFPRLVDGLVSVLLPDRPSA